MYFRSEDTIIAPATIPGTGAISVLRISGPEAFAATDRVVRFSRGSAATSEGYSLHFGRIMDGGRLIDEVLVGVFKAPHSYTGEDSTEISCHASKYIVSEILRLFLDGGVRLAEPGEFTQRAFLSGKMDLAQAEAVADVISSSSSASHRVAMNQMKGGFSKQLQSIRSQLLELTSLLELELDFSEEDVEFADRGRLMDLLGKAIGHTTALADSFREGNAVKNGIPVAILGPANAGKSTLLNALLGEQRALVSDIPGTTRDTVEELMNLGGYTFRFVDTAGIRSSSDPIEKMGIERSFDAAKRAEILILVADPTAAFSEFESFVNSLQSQVDFDDKKIIFVLNKSDICEQSGGNNFVTSYNKYVSSLDKEVIVESVSGLTGFALENLGNDLLASATSFMSSGHDVLVTNIRHYEALRQTSSALESARLSLSKSLPPDLIAEDLRAALSHLGSITGSTISPDEILGNIFKNFCIGK